MDRDDYDFKNMSRTMPIDFTEINQNNDGYNQSNYDSARKHYDNQDNYDSNDQHLTYNNNNTKNQGYDSAYVSDCYSQSDWETYEYGMNYDNYNDNDSSWGGSEQNYQFNYNAEIPNNVIDDDTEQDK